jgi:hypothetical protein
LVVLATGLSALSVSVFGVIAVAASPASAAIRVHRTTAGNQLARGVLVRRADLGSGWSQTAAPAKVPPLTCPAFNPAISGVTETGTAASPTFGHGSSGPFVSADAYVYATAGQATTVWSRAVRPQLRRCVAEGLRSASGNGTKFRVTTSGLLSLPPLGVRRAGYRIAGTATRTDQSVNVFLDALVLSTGRRLVTITVSSFFAPPTRQFELRVARIAAHRLQS